MSGYTTPFLFLKQTVPFGGSSYKQRLGIRVGDYYYSQLRVKAVHSIANIAKNLLCNNIGQHEEWYSLWYYSFCSGSLWLFGINTF